MPFPVNHLTQAHSLGALHGGAQVSTVLQGLFSEDLRLEHHRRLQTYRKYWLYYLGKHWTYHRDEGEPPITINYTRRTLDVLNDFTFKKAFKVVIPDDPLTPGTDREDREFVRVMLEESWRRNNKPLWMIEAAQQGGTTGDLFMRVSWEANDDLEEPFARVDVIPSHMCFPEFGGPHGTDRKKLVRLMILSPVWTRRPKLPRARETSSTGTNRGQVASGEDLLLIVKGEEWRSAVYADDGSLLTEATVQYFEDGAPTGTRQPNPLGEIPVVHVPNYPLSGEFYGISDCVDSSELNRELNEKVTDVSDIVNYHSSPVTIVTGAKVKDLERGANRVWALPDGATVKNLELTGDLAAANTHIGMLKESLLELVGVPEQALGSLQAVGNTSGVALAIQYLPMMEKRNIKVLTYGLGLRKVNRLMMKITALKDAAFGKKFDALEGNRFRNEVVFPDPMPFDEAAELEKSRARIDLGLSTRRRELERRGLSQAEIEEILAEVKKQMDEEAEQMFGSPTPGSPRSANPPNTRRGKNQNARGGDPAVRGTKVSRTAAQAADPTTPGD